MEFEDREELIREMRKFDPESGRPKCTQKEVGRKLGLTRARISQIEGNMDFNPYSEALEMAEITDDENDDNENMSEEETETETEEPNGKNESDDWVCNSCGNNTYYSSKGYLNRFAENLNKSQLQAVRKGDRVCAACGVVAND